MAYSPQGANWPRNPTHGGHEGFDRPAYVFVPSIGISQLLQPSPEAFPFWEDVLLVGSMRARNLWVARLDGDRIMYAEALPMEERLRDMINRRNGQVAILGDMGSLYLLRAPAETSAPVVIADHRRPATVAEHLSPVLAGEQIFSANCQSCHSLAGETRVGPPLNGVIGHAIASAEFNYSAALRSARGTWTEERLTALVTADQPLFPDSTMPPPHLTREQAHDLVEYLRTTH